MRDGEKLSWDVCQPVFVRSVWRAMIGLWLGESLFGVSIFRREFSGCLTGGLLVIALFFCAIQAGNAIFQHKQYTRIMVALLLQQLFIWVVMVILLVVVKVHPVGFVLGVSCLPAAILLTLAWYKWQSRRMPS